MKTRSLTEEGSPVVTAAADAAFGESPIVDGTFQAWLDAPGKKSPERYPGGLPPSLARVARLRLLAAGVWPFAMADCFELAVALRERVISAADAKDVDVFASGAAASVSMDRRALEEALFELLDNAITATKRGHPVTIDVRDTPHGDVIWRIGDAGPGMPDWMLTKLNHPAFRAREGLGVRFAWAVIERHRGRLRFESEEGVGTTASVWLPHRI